MKLNYFNFKPFKDKILMTNDFGKHIFVSQEDFEKILAKNVDPDSKLWNRLIDSKMIYDCSDLQFTSTNKYELREFKSHVNIATALHIFVVTTSCNMNCLYCQANSKISNSYLLMDTETAERSVDIALQSPEKNLNFEFQGGEPLINFAVVKHTTEYADQHKGNHTIFYTIVSNLTLLTEEMLDFFAKYNFSISTSIDGPEQLHNKNRPYPNGKGSFANTCRSIEKVKNAGLEIGAIETTTKFSLDYPAEIVNSYIDLGFDTIFIRPLSPLGKAAMVWNEIGYTAEQFVDFYIKVIERIIEWNKQNTFIKENHATIFWNKIHGNSVNYMELRSPCGAGVGQLAYYSDGNIFTCDEGRMLYEMGDDSFLLGNVYKSSYQELIKNNKCKTACASSILESIPGCCDCVYQPFCGTCPVANYAQGNDVIEKQPNGYRCKIYMGILDFLFSKLLENNKTNIDILNSWIN